MLSAYSASVTKIIIFIMQKNKDLKLKPNTKGVGIQLPAELHKKLKIKATENDTTLKEYIIRILNEFVEKK